MFRKVQWKFFAFTTSILLAIFIVLLTSINLIMQSVMQRQSIVVLRQIASSVEYDDETDSFVYFEKNDRPDDEPKDIPEPDDSLKNQDNEVIPPSKQTTAVSSSAANTVTSSAQTRTTTNPDQKFTDKPKEQLTPSPEINSEDDSSTVENTTKNQNSGTPAVTTAVASSSGRTTTQAAQIPTNAPSAGTKAAQTQSPTTSPAATKAAETPASPQVTTKTAQSPTAANTPAATESATEAPQESTDEQSSQYPWADWEDWNNWHEWNDWNYPDEWENDNPQFYDWFENESGGRRHSYYSEDDAEAQSYSSSDDGEIAQLAGNLDPVLDGYTILREEAEPSRTGEEAPVPKSLGSIDFFVLMADIDGNFLASLNNDELTDETAQNYINGVIKNSSDEGMLDTLQYFQLEKENGTIMVFTDKSAELDMLEQLMHTTVAIGIISFIVLSILTYFLSKKSIQPVKVAFEKQKQFISDASHELKTPLTIISANADILADEVGENKWLEYIKSQTDRMNILVNELLNLTRLENNTANFICCEFDLSKAIENTALPFECQAFESKKTFDIDIQEGLSANGSETHIKQMAAIFIDNALKYSNDGGTVRITLRSQGDKKILSVFNTGAGIKEGEENKIFERFYRSDDSRARTTGGYGLGLAIAKSIIDKHKFKLTIDNVPGESVCFNVTM